MPPVPAPDVVSKPFLPSMSLSTRESTLFAKLELWGPALVLPMLTLDLA